MAKRHSYLLDFEIDKLTDSILNRISGDSFRTEISLLTKFDLKTITKQKGWSFDWKYEFGLLDREIYKLTIVDNPEIVQGLISLTIKTDHVYMYLLESSPFNIGKNKLYEGFRAIWSLLPVNFLFSGAAMALYPSNLRPN